MYKIFSLLQTEGDQCISALGCQDKTWTLSERTVRHRFKENSFFIFRTIICKIAVATASSKKQSLAAIRNHFSESWLGQTFLNQHGHPPRSLLEQGLHLTRHILREECCSHRNLIPYEIWQQWDLLWQQCIFQKHLQVQHLLLLVVHGLPLSSVPVILSFLALFLMLDCNLIFFLL